MVLYAGAAINWSSRKQTIVITSSTKAEYVAMGHATKEALWIARLFCDLHLPPSGPLRIFANNQSSIILADSERISSHIRENLGAQKSGEVLRALTGSLGHFQLSSELKRALRSTKEPQKSLLLISKEVLSLFETLWCSSLLISPLSAQF